MIIVDNRYFIKARGHARCFACNISFSPQDNSWERSIIIPLYRQGNYISERLGHLPRIIQPDRCKVAFKYLAE